MRHRHFRIALASIIAVSLSAAALAHSGATGIVKERMDRFARSKDNLKAIETYLRSGDFDAIVPQAEEIRDWAAEMPDYFPEGSNQKPSAAAPEIWTNFHGFKTAAQTHYEAADGLVSAAMSKDADATMAAFSATAATCKSCHQSFRID